ncbi:unnamed protein product [Trifolium pratense]|uniref:Uncharacterized protein n=1 Tax=Trifolium pratense TaxID=57577 RepID=A0ACB0LAD4_TRIPR|nr:unnamed protein product [Trifolium pratense]
MPPKMKRPCKKQKTKNNLNEAENTNNMSKSRKCPISKRRKLIPNPTTIFDHWCTLRSSGRLQTGTTSLEQVVETHVEVEVTPLVQVAELGEVEMSLSGRSNQMAAQNMFEEEAIPCEQVGEMHEKAGELGEAEMSLSSCSNQNAGQNTLEAETIPLKQEPLAGEIQASRVGCSAPSISLNLTEMVDMVRNEDDDDEVEDTVVKGYKVEAEFMPILCKIIDKHGEIAGENTFVAETIPLEQEPLVGEIQTSRAACSAPSISLKLTKIVGMVRNEDVDDEVDSNIQSGLEDTVNGYKVDAEFMPILSKIIEKHGDIAKNCKRSVEYRSMLLDRICRIVSELDKKNVTDIKEKDLETQIVLVDDIKTNEVEVNWLHTRLTEIREAKQILKKCGKLKDKLDNDRDCIEITSSSLKILEDQKKEASEKLREASKELETISQKEAEWKRDWIEIGIIPPRYHKKLKMPHLKSNDFLIAH